MRRRLFAGFIVLVAVIFLLLALPGSPVSGWLAGVLAGHGGKGTVGRAPAPAIRQAARRDASLRVAIGAMVSPVRTYLEYGTLFDHVARSLGAGLNLLQRRSYAEVNELVRAGEVDLAWVCTGALAELERQGAATVVAVPVVGGETEYRAYLVVRRDSGFERLEDLRGTKVALTDPLSLTGRKVLEEWLAGQGESVESFFSDSFYTHAHDNSLRAVVRGLADAATVDSLVFDYLKERSPEEVAGAVVIRRSRPFPIPPLVAPAKTPPERLARLREALFGLAETEDGRAELERIGVERFVPPPPGLYSVR